LRLTETIKSDIASEVMEKHNRWRLFKLPYEGNFFLNLAFYYGFQWTVYNIVTAELAEIDNPAGTIRITSNQIQPRIRNLHAKMTKNRPIIEVTCNSYKDDAIFAANVSRKLLDQFREDHSEDEKDSETINWLLIAGNCYRKIGFDPTEGQSLALEMEKYYNYATVDEETGQPEENEGWQANLESLMQRSDISMGDIFDEVIPPFEILLPEWVTSPVMVNTQEIMHVKLMPVSDIKMKWGKKAAKISPMKDITISSQFQRRLLGMASPEISGSYGISEALLKDEDVTYVFELWKKPNKKYPRGLVTIVAGSGPDSVLFADDNPYLETLESVGFKGGLPFIQYRGIQAPGRAWDISPVEGMRPLQVEYNKCISDIVQNRATIGRNKLVAPRTANIDEEEIANIHGQFLQYSGIMPPQVVPAVPLPQQVDREIERNRLDMDTISGSHEVSRAEVPSGVKSGIAINYLLEQDDTTLAPIIGSYEISKKQLARAKLALAKQFFTEPRFLREINSDDPEEIASFTGSDITTTIRLVTGSALPKSRAALQATYLDLWDRKAIVDENGMPDTHKLFRLLKDAMGIETFIEEDNLDIGRARRENLMLMRGQEIIPQHWENHLVHFMEHNRFRKTDRFYTLPPQIQQNFEMHVVITMQFLAPPTKTPGAEEAVMLGAGGAGGGSSPARRSPGMIDQGVGGQLNNPPSPGGLR